MNIDIVNKQVANDLGIAENKVKLINSFYWRSIYEHLYSYSSSPVNIEQICVLYPNKYLIKKAIYMYIFKLKNLRNSKKFKEDSPKKQSYEEIYKATLRKFLKLRKDNKFTN